MKLIKNRFHTCNDWFSHLDLMIIIIRYNIESDILREIKLEDLVTELARTKARNVLLIQQEKKRLHLVAGWVNGKQQRLK